jgi:hypothetical protein
MPNNSPVNTTNVNISNNDKKMLSDVRQILDNNKRAASIEKKENEWLLQKKDPKRTLSNSALDDKLRTSIDKAYRQLFTGRYTTARDELIKEYDQLNHASKSLNSLYATLSASNDDIYDLQLDLDIQLNIMRQIITNTWSGGKRMRHRRRATRAKRRRSKNKSRRR